MQWAVIGRMRFRRPLRFVGRAKRYERKRDTEDSESETVPMGRRLQELGRGP